MTAPTPEPGTRPVLVLVGPAGSGTTTVGRLVAETLGRGVIDTDRAVAARLGQTEVAVAFVVAGEETFRAVERDVTLEALGSHPGVLVLGSGAVLDEDVQAALAGVPVVALTVSLAHAAPRLGLSTARPVFLGNPRSLWQREHESRRPLYASLAVRVVDTDDRTPADVAAEIAAAVTAGDLNRELRTHG